MASQWGQNFEFRTKNDISWEQFHCWIKQLGPTANLPSLPDLRVMITYLDSKFKELKRNKQHDKLGSEAFFGKYNVLCKHSIESKVQNFPETKAVSSFDLEVLTMVNHKLASELTKAKNALL